VGRVHKIVAGLLAGGLPPDTPAAAIRWGTRPEQETVRSTLAALPDQPLAPPATIVIGRVAALNLDWFESRPLFGRRVVVTRAREQASALAARLRSVGAEPVEIPTILVAEPLDGGAALNAAVAAIHAYDWVVLTSPNGARRFFASLHDARDLGGVRVACIGPGTAEVTRAANVVADLVPPRFVAESLLDAFPRPQPGGRGRVLLARAEVARDVLPTGLVELGWQVDVVDAYRTLAAEPTPDQRAAAAGADIVTFTSSSTVDRFLDAIGPDAVPPIVACIGPATADTARRRGLTVDVVAAEHTIPGLVAALVEHVRGTA